jgi:mono/diheme cytochrome c family protein
LDLFFVIERHYSNKEGFMERFVFAALCAVAVIFFGGEAGSAVDAGKVFSSKCAMCHGKAAQGGPMGPALKGNEFVQKTEAADLKKLILEGRKKEAKIYPKIPGGMPAIKLTDDELTAIVDYIKEMK